MASSIHLIGCLGLVFYYKANNWDSNMDSLTEYITAFVYVSRDITYVHDIAHAYAHPLIHFFSFTNFAGGTTTYDSGNSKF